VSSTCPQQEAGIFEFLIDSTEANEQEEAIYLYIGCHGHNRISAAGIWVVVYR